MALQESETEQGSMVDFEKERERSEVSRRKKKEEEEDDDMGRRVLRIFFFFS